MSAEATIKGRAHVPIRIYALAKELKIDSKELVDICTKAGITGKGSALASLDDDELAKVKSFLDSGSDKPPAASGAPGTGGTPGRVSRIGRGALKGRSGSAAGQDPVDAQPFTRDDYIAPGSSGGKIKVIAPRVPQPQPDAEPPAPEIDAPTSDPAVPVADGEAAIAASERPSDPAVAAPDATEPVTEPAAAEPDTGEPTVADPKVAPSADSGPEVESSAAALLRPDEPLAPPSREISTSLPRPKKKKEALAHRKRKRRAPVINVAPLPQVKQPAAKPAEPKAQKPDIRLPKDAMTKRKGDRPLPPGHLAAQGRPTRGPATPADRAPAGDESSGKGKGRRGGGREESQGKRGLAGMASTRQDRKVRRTARRVRGGRDDEGGYRRRRTLVHKGTNTAAPRKGKVALELPCTVRSFSEAAGVSAAQVLKVLMGMGQMTTVNSQIDDEVVEILAAELGVELEFKQQESLEESVITAIRDATDSPEDLIPRPPVITFLGHVDHGKTSLLDHIIGSNVVAGEAGGITQHIRAYQIEKNGRKISFVDTPGHEAFTEMRARGANVTDVAVLVIAADDGIMPQTEEAISHARAAEVPIVVALNKIDLAGADANRVMTQMTEYGLTPSQWGGDVEVIETSALSGQGIDELLETLLTIADMNEYSANPERAAMGSCLEAQQEGSHGVVAKLIVKNGSLNVGDVVVCGVAFGRVRAMYDTMRPQERIESAGPSMPVNITGFDIAPEAGEPFYVLPDIAQARQIAENRESASRRQSLAGNTIRVSFEEFQRRLSEGRLSETAEVVTLNLIIRADVRGSIEAIQKELGKLEHPEVQIRILHASVGAISIADITLAHASQAVVIGFNVIPDDAARTLADERDVEIRRYDVIYKVTDDIRALLEGKLKPEERTIELGQALVKQVFSISRVGAIAGCYIVRGTMERGCRVRLHRDGKAIGDYELESLRREKEDVKETRAGMECGIKLSGFNDVKQDDVLEAYKIEEIARTL